MQVTSELIEKAARAMCIQGGFDPDELMPNDGPRWRYYVGGACAALTALSDKQAGEVKIKPLEWRAEPPYHVARVFGNVYAVEAWDGGVTLSGIGGCRDFKTISEAKAAAQTDYEQRIRSALVDVPAVESVAIYHGNGLIDCGDAGHHNIELVKLIPAGTKLYARPPLREGEDSAAADQYWSTVEQLANCEDEISRLREILTRAEEYVIDGVTTAKAEAEMNAPYPARAHRYDAALAEVRQLYTDIQGTLAATRSGSATSAKGCADEN